MLNNSFFSSVKAEKAFSCRKDRKVLKENKIEQKSLKEQRSETREQKARKKAIKARERIKQAEKRSQENREVRQIC
jgi:hypothetical protein